MQSDVTTFQGRELINQVAAVYTLASVEKPINKCMYKEEKRGPVWQREGLYGIESHHLSGELLSMRRIVFVDGLNQWEFCFEGRILPQTQIICQLPICQVVHIVPSLLLLIFGSELRRVRRQARSSRVSSEE